MRLGDGLFTEVNRFSAGGGGTAGNRVRWSTISVQLHYTIHQNILVPIYCH